MNCVLFRAPLYAARMQQRPATCLFVPPSLPSGQRAAPRPSPPRPATLAALTFRSAPMRTSSCRRSPTPSTKSSRTFAGWKPAGQAAGGGGGGGVGCQPRRRPSARSAAPPTPPAPCRPVNSRPHQATAPRGWRQTRGRRRCKMGGGGGGGGGRGGCGWERWRRSWCVEAGVHPMQRRRPTRKRSLTPPAELPGELSCRAVPPYLSLRLTAARRTSGAGPRPPGSSRRSCRPALQHITG